MQFPSVLLAVFIFTPIISQSDPVSSTDSLFKLRSETTGLNRANIDLEIARYHFMRDMDSVNYYVELLEKFIDHTYDKRIDAFIRKFKGYNAHLNLEIEQAMDYARQSMKLFEELGDYREVGWLLLNSGLNYYRLGDFASATDQHLKALSYFEQVDHQRGIAEVYNGLGRISYQTEHMQKAMEYFQSALEIFNQLERNDQKSKIFNNMGIMYLNNGEIEKSLENLFKAANGFKSDGDERSLALVYGNIALGYDKLNQPDLAMTYCRLALRHSKNAGDEYGIINGIINLGYFLRINQHYDSSRICLDKALEMAMDKNLVVFEEEIYGEYADLYADMGNYRTAYAYKMKYDSIHRVIIDEKSQQRIDDLLFSYKQKLKEQELEQLRADQKMQLVMNNIFILLIILSFMVLVILIYGYRSSRKQKWQLEEKNLLLKKYNLRLERSEQDLKEMNDEKNKLFSIVAHDLRNPIAAVSGFTELLIERFDELDEDTKKEYIDQIMQGSMRSLSLLENLLLWARSQMDIIKIKKTLIPVHKLIDECTGHLMSSIEKKNLDLIIDFKDEFDLYIDREMIQAVLRNLISNAIKFSFPGNSITLTCKRENGTSCITVTDHGTGISPENMEIILSAGNITTTEGTSGEQGSGLGLLISRDYTEKNGGKLYAESELGKGTKFSICFPVLE